MSKKSKPLLTPDLEGVDIVFYNPKIEFHHEENKAFVSNLELEEIIKELDSDVSYYIVLYLDEENQLACLRDCRIGYMDEETLGINYSSKLKITLDEDSDEYKIYDSEHSIYRNIQPYIRKAKIDSALD
jgi:hypothetical protein